MLNKRDVIIVGISLLIFLIEIASTVSYDIDDPVLGNKDAKVTIIEFSDYQCPFCRKFWTDTLPELKKNYIDTGKVKLVLRDFPLVSIHPSAQIASEAAECVREKGRDSAYFKYHDKLFEEQNKLDSGTKSGPVTKTVQFTAADLKKWAKELGYDIGSCLDDGKYSSEVEKDLADGSAAGVQGTPSFFINGKMLGGAYPYSEFKKIVDEELGENTDSSESSGGSGSGSGGEPITGEIIDEEEKAETCFGCKVEEKCYPLGYRKSGKFCSAEDNAFQVQLEEEISCENNFECSSYVCVSGKCVSGGLLQRILNWFGKLFS